MTLPGNRCTMGQSRHPSSYRPCVLARAGGAGARAPAHAVGGATSGVTGLVVTRFGRRERKVSERGREDAMRTWGPGIVAPPCCARAATRRAFGRTVAGVAGLAAGAGLGPPAGA